MQNSLVSPLEWLRLNSEAITGSNIFTDLYMGHGSPAAWPLCWRKSHNTPKEKSLRLPRHFLRFSGGEMRKTDRRAAESSRSDLRSDPTATSETSKCQVRRHFQDFRGHFDWSQLSVSVTWILSPDGKHNLFKLPQRDLARQWVHSTRTHTDTHIQWQVRRAFAK